jgi:hypothetical protein
VPSFQIISRLLVETPLAVYACLYTAPRPGLCVQPFNAVTRNTDAVFVTALVCLIKNAQMVDEFNAPILAVITFNPDRPGRKTFCFITDFSQHTQKVRLLEKPFVDLALRIVFSNH